MRDNQEGPSYGHDSMIEEHGDMEVVPSHSPSTHSSTDFDSHHTEDEVNTSNRNAWGLVLRPLPDGQYIRIGIFKSGGTKQGGRRAFQDRPSQVFNIV